MLHLIDEIKDIPGVVGVCIYNLQQGLQESNLPGFFKPEKLTDIGRYLTKLYATGQMSFNDLTDVTLYYDESVVVARELKKYQLIFAICDPSFNYNLLSISFNLLQEEMHDDLADNDDGEPLEHPGGNTIPLETKQTGGQDLTALFVNLSEHLVKIVGPMAGIIFDEVLDEWQKQGPVVISRLEDLLAALDRKIEDPEKIVRYRKLIEPVLKKNQDR